MSNGKKYDIRSTRNRVYLDKAGKAVSGFALVVYLPTYDEELEILVPSLEPKEVDKAISKLVDDRDALAALGK